jgi:tetratricopeptide (TPR) repeat protein
MAYAGLADCYAMLPDYGASVEDIPKAKAAATRAIELDPALSRPYVNLGGMKMAHEWDFAGGEAEFKKALELDPKDSHAHQRYADNLGLLGGREQEALVEINRAHELDPRSLTISVDVGNVYTYARRFDEAIVVCQKVASENPTFAGAHDCLANAYWGKKMYPQVIEEWKAYGKLTSERSDSDYAAALEQGFRSGSWKGALSRSRPCWPRSRWHRLQRRAAIQTRPLRVVWGARMVTTQWRKTARATFSRSPPALLISSNISAMT